MEKQENKKQPEDRNEAGNQPVRDEELENVSGGVVSEIDWQASGPNGFKKNPPAPLFGPGSGMIGENTGS